MRFEALPGESSQHNFGEVEVELGNGTGRRVYFFASRLKYSRGAQVSLVDDERVEALVCALFGAEYSAHTLSLSLPPAAGRRQQELAL